MSSGRTRVFTHMNVLDDAEVDAVVDSGMALVWHPGNFMYYADRPAGAANRFPELHRRGSAIGFGTDVAKVWAFGDLGFIGYLVSREWGEYRAVGGAARDVHAAAAPGRSAWPTRSAASRPASAPTW